MIDNKRVISWTEYFMEIAKISSRRSKDPNTRVGACIVSEENKIIGTGYNGFPYGTGDVPEIWCDRSTDLLVNKYSRVVHAELNAILNSSVSLHGATLYVTLFPCNECAKAIVQSRIATVIYLEDTYYEEDFSEVSRQILSSGGVETVQYSDID